MTVATTQNAPRISQSHIQFTLLNFVLVPRPEETLLFLQYSLRVTGEPVLVGSAQTSLG